jgi:hypothetical protein
LVDVTDNKYASEQVQSHERKPGRGRMVWRVGAGVSFAAAAVAAVAVATSGSGTQAPATSAALKPATGSTTAAAPAQETPLVQLVGYLSKADAPKGDATLLLRDQVYTTGLKVDVWDLHADNGDYYFSKTKAGIPGQVAGHKNRGGEDEVGRQKAVAAAKKAAKGDLNTARKDMAWAYVPKNPKVKPTLAAPGWVPPAPTSAKLPKGLKDIAQINGTDNWVWNNSMDALRDGAGNPQVRAGVLRLLGQMPEVKVAKGTYQGQAVLNLTAGKPATTTAETLTVNAETGLPIKYSSDGVTINYTVTRVTLADVAKGKF